MKSQDIKAGLGHNFLDLDTAPPIGREQETAWVLDALADKDTRIAALIAPGGVGKSEVMKEVARSLSDPTHDQGWQGVVGFSFYSQGSTDRVVSAEEFFEHAFRVIGLPADRYQQLPPAARGELLARTLEEKKYLVLLDGLEPLQFGSGPIRGSFKDKGVFTFLAELVASEKSESQVVITSRVELSSFASLNGGVVKSRELDLLAPAAALALVERNGIKSDPEHAGRLIDACGSHALTVALAARQIAVNFDGDASQFLAHHENSLKGTKYAALLEAGNHGAHAFKLLDSIITHKGPDHIEVQALKLMGLFDRPIQSDVLDQLRRDSRIAGPELAALTPQQWASTLSTLREQGLLFAEQRSAVGVVDAHPLIREFFGPYFRASSPEGWREACARLGETFSEQSKAEGLTPVERYSKLYQAVRFYCLAEKADEAISTLRSVWQANSPEPDNRFAATRKFGLHGLELVAISSFFKEPFGEFHEWVSPQIAADLLVETGIRLRNVGRIAEAKETFEVVLSEIQHGKIQPRPEHLQGLCGLVDMYAALGESDLACSTGHYVKELAEKLGAPDKIALSLGRLLEAHLSRFEIAGDHADVKAASEFGAQLLKVAHSNTRLLESQNLFSLALLYGQNPDPGQCRAFLDLVDQMEQERGGDKISLLGRAIRPLARGTALLAIAQASQGEESSDAVQDATEELKKAVPLLYQSGYSDYLVPGLIMLSRAKDLSGDAAGSAALLEQGKRAASDCQMGRFLAW